MKKIHLTTVFNVIERIGNRLPHPVTLFALMAGLVIVFSALFEIWGVQCVYTQVAQGVDKIPDSITVSAKSLLSAEGITYILGHLISNFTGFAPLGIVLVVMLGIGVAENAGLINTLLYAFIGRVPKRMLSMAIVFLGVLSSIASDAGYVVLIPLGAVIFKAFGRHPLAGLAAAFAGVSGGFCANLSVTGVDVLLAGITQAGAQIIDPLCEIAPTCNYYYMAAATFVVTLLGAWVTDRIVEPSLNQNHAYESENDASAPLSSAASTALTPLQKRGLCFAGITLLALAGIIAWGLIPHDGILRMPGGEIFGNSLFLKAFVPILFILFLLTGLAYGIGAKTIQSDKDAEGFMSKSMSAMGTYIVLAFFAAQFIAYFNYSNLGIIIAVKGASFLQSIHLNGFVLIVCFVFIAALINLFIGSASAKWAIMAPIFIPLFMQLGYTPEFGQLAYRIGDSVTNIITPLMSYFALIIAFATLYDKKLQMGTLLAMMMPYSIVFLIGYLTLLSVWYFFNLPLGPGVGIFINAL